MSGHMCIYIYYNIIIMGICARARACVRIIRLLFRFRIVTQTFFNLLLLLLHLHLLLFQLLVYIIAIIIISIAYRLTAIASRSVGDLEKYWHFAAATHTRPKHVRTAYHTLLQTSSSETCAPGRTRRRYGNPISTNRFCAAAVTAAERVLRKRRPRIAHGRCSSSHHDAIIDAACTCTVCTETNSTIFCNARTTTRSVRW